jgi:nucleoid DNA-binding protein
MGTIYLGGGYNMLAKDPVKKKYKAETYKYKNRTHREVYDIVEKELPISLKNNENLINQIHERYPILSKTEISIIVKMVFSSLREMLILGKIINIRTILAYMRLSFNKVVFKNKKNQINVKVKLHTPDNLR